MYLNVFKCVQMCLNVYIPETGDPLVPLPGVLTGEISGRVGTSIRDTEPVILNIKSSLINCYHFFDLLYTFSVIKVSICY